MKHLRRLLVFVSIFVFSSILIVAQEDSPDSPFALASDEPVLDINGNPGAMIYHDGMFHMFANVYDTFLDPVEIHYFTSPDGIAWTQASDEPLLDVSTIDYADYTVFASDVLVNADGEWLLYFYTWESEDDFARSAIGLASASDPLGEWTVLDEVILSPSTDPEGWDAVQATAPSVIATESGYAMYYAGVATVDNPMIGYATSPDGITWTKQNDPITEDAFAESDPLLQTLGSPSIRPRFQRIWQPDVIDIDFGYMMTVKSGRDLYEAGGAMVRYGFSEDGQDWDFDFEQQAFLASETNGTAIWDTALVYHDSTFWLYMAVENEGTTQIYLATFAEPEPDPIISTVQEIGNFGNGADIRITIPNISDYQIIVSKSDSDSTQALDASMFVTALAENDRELIITLLPEAVDSDGELIVEDTEYTISVVDNADASTLISETLTLVNETFVRTVISGLDAAAGGLDVDAEGNIYFADFGEPGRTRGTVVYQISPDGAIVTPYLERSDLAVATGNVFDSDGNFYQSSLGTNILFRVSPTGEASVFASDNLDSPVGVTIDDDGIFYVANCNSESIARITADGETEIFVESPILRCANGITLDGEGNIYVANFFNGNIIHITPDGETDVLATLPGGNNGHVVYRDGLLYAVARGDHQVYMVTLDGEITLLAGTGERGNADGPALEATFSLPNDLVFSHDGRELYVNEGDALTTGRNHPALVRAIVFER